MRARLPDLQSSIQEQAVRNKVVGASALALCITALVNHTTAADLPRLQDWPRVESAVASDAAVE